MVGEKLKRLREEKGMTQRELAEKVNINQSMIAQIERGTKNMSIELGEDVAKILGCEIGDFGTKPTP
jgi:transcriptional regulator with XRE-family HTH domain